MVSTSRTLRSIERLLLAVERQVALISRCRPRNALTEQQSLVAAWQSGRRRLPRWTYEAVPELSAHRQMLSEASTWLSEAEPLHDLYFQRIAELQLETRLVEAVGTRQFVELARHRHEHGSAAERADALALVRRWLLIEPEAPRTTIRSDDEQHPQSLYSSMCRAVGQLRLPVRVTLSDSLVAAAATGENLIVVAKDRHLSLNDTRRIVLHETLGHALPRHRATQQTVGLFAVGSAGGNDEQEGYALFLESRGGVMDEARRRELALRHIAALGVHDGANWVETTERLTAEGAELASAAAIASRVHRAGGLAREVVYLPALCRVNRAIGADPDVEEWLGRGRLSLDAIDTLRQFDAPPVLAADG